MADPTDSREWFVHVVGSAQPKKDGPFHQLEKISAAQGNENPFAIFRDSLQNVMRLASSIGARDQLKCPPPHECHPGPTGDGCEFNHKQWISGHKQDKEGQRYVGDLSDTMAEYLVDAHIEQTELCRQKLKEKLATYGDLILTRWKKMSQEKRAKLLSKAAPRVFGEWPMPQEEVGAGFFPKNPSVWKFGRWASITDFMEDRMKLLSLLHVRAEYPASAWAVFDTRESEVAFVAKDMQPLWYNDKCVTMHADGFGNLVDFDVALTHCWAIIGFPRAFMTLQAQLDLLLALREIVSAIIGDSEGTGAPKWTELVKDGFGGTGRVARWSAYFNQAFAPPSVFRPEAMLEIAKSRLDMIMDDVWLMQTEPAYFQQVLKARKADISNVCIDLASQDQCGRVASELVIELMQRIQTWSHIVSECEMLCKVFKEYGDQCSTGKLLPLLPAYHFSHLMQTMDGSLKTANASFNSLMSTMRPFKDCFTVSRRPEGGFSVDEKEALDPADAADRLRHHLRVVDDVITQGRPLGGLSFIFESLEKEIKSQSISTRLVDARFIDNLADMTVNDELCTMYSWSQLGIYRGEDPLAGMKLTEEWYKSLQCDDEFRLPSTAVMRAIRRPMKLRLGALIKDFLAVPWPKGDAKDFRWLQKASECRKRQGKFWDAFREEYRNQDSVMEGEITDENRERVQEAIDRFLADVSFDQDPAFLRAVELERKACEIETAKKAAEELATANQNARELLQDVWGDGSSHNPTGRKQTKAKAARDANAEMKELCEDLQSARVNGHINPAASEVEEQPPIPVKKESLTLFRKMYSSQGINTVSDTPWIACLQAMADAGFTVTEGSGSAVRFNNSQGSICFHRPHPDAVVDPIMLHNMGRRLHKWFGFGGQTFVLRS